MPPGAARAYHSATMKKRRYVVAAVVAVAGFCALFIVLPSQGAGFKVRMAAAGTGPT